MKDEKRNQEELKIEISETHFDSRERNESQRYHCHFFPCPKNFKSKDNLDLHILNTHLKIKPFKCCHCEKVFSHHNGKKYHERTKHINYLPYACLSKNCTKKFASASSLQFHVKSKH